MGERRRAKDLRTAKERPIELKVWRSMRARCRDKNNKNYGARGISVCKRWNESFYLFFKDMGPRPSPEHSIDRINNNGNYCKNNCRWATAKQQARNRANSMVLTFNGETLSIHDWSERLGIKKDTLICRFICGNSIERVLHQGKLKPDPSAWRRYRPGWDPLYRDAKRAKQSRDRRKLLAKKPDTE